MILKKEDLKKGDIYYVPEGLVDARKYRVDLVVAEDGKITIIASKWDRFNNKYDQPAGVVFILTIYMTTKSRRRRIALMP